MPSSSLHPWLGLGIGYEIAHGESKPFLIFTLRGWEFVNLQAGLDFEVAKGVGVGPFLSFSLARYANGKIEDQVTPPTSGEVNDKTMHEWLVFGLRGSFHL